MAKKSTEQDNDDKRPPDFEGNGIRVWLDPGIRHIVLRDTHRPRPR